MPSSNAKKKDVQPPGLSEQPSLRPNSRATTRSAKKQSDPDTTPKHTKSHSEAELAAPTVATQTNSYAALAADDTDDESQNPIQPESTLVSAQLGSVETHIKEGHDRLLLALGSLDTGLHDNNDLFRKVCERSEQNSLRLGESLK